MYVTLHSVCKQQRACCQHSYIGYLNQWCVMIQENECFQKFSLSLLSKLLSLQVTQSSSKPKSKWLLVIPFDHTPEQAVSLLPITVCVYLLLLSLYGFSASIDNSSHLRQQAVLTLFQWVVLTFLSGRFLPFFSGRFLPSLVGGSYLLQWAVLTFFFSLFSLHYRMLWCLDRHSRVIKYI